MNWETLIKFYKNTSDQIKNYPRFMKSIVILSSVFSTPKIAEEALDILLDRTPPFMRRTIIIQAHIIQQLSQRSDTEYIFKRLNHKNEDQRRGAKYELLTMMKLSTHVHKFVNLRTGIKSTPDFEVYIGDRKCNVEVTSLNVGETGARIHAFDMMIMALRSQFQDFNFAGNSAKPPSNSELQTIKDSLKRTCESFEGPLKTLYFSNLATIYISKKVNHNEIPNEKRSQWTYSYRDHRNYEDRIVTILEDKIPQLSKDGKDSLLVVYQQSEIKELVNLCHNSYSRVSITLETNPSVMGLVISIRALFGMYAEHIKPQRGLANREIIQFKELVKETSLIFPNLEYHGSNDLSSEIFNAFYRYEENLEKISKHLE